jgi:predicted lipoprotein with Yx(FWY)xxD motif
MKTFRSTLLALGLAVGALAATTGPADASALRTRAGTVVNLEQTPLGAVLVDGRGRTLYLFDKDRNGISACTSACLDYWPALTSRATPRAGKGVQQSLLRVSRAPNGRHQVTYAGHPLYTFVGDKHAGQTSGEGLNTFGAEWYAVAADGHAVEPATSSSGGY